MEPDRKSYEPPLIISEGFIVTAAGSEIDSEPLYVELMDPLEAKALGLDSPLE
jgi:hypothetical protein